MKCPRCNSEFENVIYEGVALDRCLMCKGIWFDIFEVETLKKIRGSAEIDIGASLESQVPNDDVDLICPNCETKMTILAGKNDAAITYHKCPVCYGVWFDAGQFKPYRENSLLRSIKRLISR